MNKELPFEVNVSVACQFEDTSWDYLDEPVYTQRFKTLKEAKEYFGSKGFDVTEVMNHFIEKHKDDCIALEFEYSITEDSYEFAHTSDGEYFENENFWSRKDYDEFFPG